MTAPRRHDLRLFDDFERTDMDRARPSEEGFAWWNRTARPEVAAMRSELECWFSRYCPEDAPRLRREFRTRRRPQHVGALFELFVHEQLVKAGFDVECQLMLPGTPNRPDFLAHRAGCEPFYVEAKTKLESSETAADEKRLRIILDEVRSLPSRGFAVGVSSHGTPPRTVETISLRRGVSDWLQSLDYEHELAVSRAGRHSQQSVWTWSADQFHLRFHAVPVERPHGELRPTVLGYMLPGTCQLSVTDRDIAAAVEEKASHYGHLEHPYIIAINLMDIRLEPGDVEAGVSMAFGSIAHPRNSRVSALLLGQVANMASAVDGIARLVANPTAERPLGETTVRFTPYQLDPHIHAWAATP
ncbi:MAG: hypothetical protein U0704_03620 [Candidatus Eisenbacteria bacterium]